MARETVTITGLDDVLRRLKALGPEASKRGGPIRAAVRKGAMVIVNEAKANIRKIVAEPNIGGDNVSTGLMEKSVKPMRAKARRDGVKGETFVVTIPRKARYPITQRTPSGIPVATVGRILEYHQHKAADGGTHPPKPWMRPAFHAKKDEAAKVMADEVLNGIARLEKKLART